MKKTHPCDGSLGLSPRGKVAGGDQDRHVTGGNKTAAGWYCRTHGGVFPVVSLGNGRFESRDLTLGVEGDNGDYAVLDGIEEGERIVLSGQFLIDSESRLKEAAARMLGPDAQTDSDRAATDNDPNHPLPDK